jgi:two-component system, OmpR family, response regulator
MPGSKRILVVEDEPQMLGLLRTILEGQDYDVAQASDGAGLRNALTGRPFDLITLDLGLPGYSGIDLARELCQSTTTPFIVVSGRADENDRVLALELGADDYISKPFSPRELTARVHAVMRRAEGVPQRQQSTTILKFHNYALNTQTRKLVDSRGAVTAMTVAECQLLEVLVAKAGSVCTRDEITMHMKGRAWSPTDRSLDTLVVHLRRKIEANPAQPVILMNVRGIGYMMTANP